MGAVSRPLTVAGFEDLVSFDLLGILEDFCFLLKFCSSFNFEDFMVNYFLLIDAVVTTLAVVMLVN